MAEINSLSVTDASNTARFPENQNPSTVNDGARSLEGIIARWHKDTNASVDAGGTGDAITVAANQTLTAYYDGLVIAFNATAANTTATTLNVDSVGAKKVFKNFNSELVANDIKSGQKVICIYDSDGDSSAGSWQMVSQLGNGATAASESASGVAELATQSETNTGSDDARIVTPLKLTTWSPAVSTVSIASGDKVLIADSSDSGKLKQAAYTDFGRRIQKQTTSKTGTSTVAITAGTYADATGVSVSITATSGNRVVIKFSITLGVASGPETGYLRLVRDSTAISPVGASPSNRVAASWACIVTANTTMTTVTGEYEDTAPDSSSHTYKIQFTASTSENWHINKSESDTDSTSFARAASWITAEEYAA